MHPEVMDFVRARAGWVEKWGYVLEIGGRDINGSVKGLFDGYAQYISLDLFPGKGVDLVADAAELPFPERLFSGVVCCEVFEHTWMWPIILSEAARVLKPGGLFIATMATGSRPPHSAYDEQPIRPEEFYENVDPGRLEAFMSHFFSKYDVRIARDGLDLYAVGWR